MVNKKLLVVTVTILLIALGYLFYYYQQPSGGVNKVRCGIIINSIIKEQKVVAQDKISLLKAKNITQIRSLYPKIPEGNLGINPLQGYYFVYDIDFSYPGEYYLLVKQLYSETWYGPYEGSVSDTACFPQI